MPEPDAIYRTNVEGTRALLIAVAEAGVARIVYTSSVATLGLARDGQPADETTPSTLGDMIGHYKRLKCLAELPVRELIERQGLPAVVVNPAAPIGPRDVEPTPTGRIVLEVAKGRVPAYVDSGLNVVHVDDVAAGHLQAYERGRIGQGTSSVATNLSLGEIFAMIARLVGRRPPRVRLPAGLILPLAYLAEAAARLGHSGEPFVTRDNVRMAQEHMYFSSALAERELGFRSAAGRGGRARRARLVPAAWLRQLGRSTWRSWVRSVGCSGSAWSPC